MQLVRVAVSCSLCKAFSALAKGTEYTGWPESVFVSISPGSGSCVLIADNGQGCLKAAYSFCYTSALSVTRSTQHTFAKSYEKMLPVCTSFQPDRDKCSGDGATEDKRRCGHCWSG